jgi:hypothetical protein
MAMLVWDAKWEKQTSSALVRLRSVGHTFIRVPVPCKTFSPTVGRPTKWPTVTVAQYRYATRQKIGHCVESTARDAYQMNSGVTTVSDATGTCNEADQLAALHALRTFGGTASTAEVVEALHSRNPRAS